MTERVSANGIEFVVLEEGGTGPLALCLHGFPDSAHTWRHLLPALAEAGFHAVAPFMRGYSPSSIPADGDYRLTTIAADANALHDVLGGDDEAVLIGNDWGAEAAYLAGAVAPERWRRLVTLAIPPLALDPELFADAGQRKRFEYLFFLRTPEAEKVVTGGGMAFLDRLWSDWSPGYDAGRDLSLAKDCIRNPANLSAAIGYYRADQPESIETAPQATLYLHGDRDGCIALDLVRDAERHLAPGSRMVVVEGAGHFLQLEKPREVNRLIIDWIRPAQ